MKKQNFEALMKEIRDEQVPEQAVVQASERVWARLTAAPVVPDKLRSCADFQALISDYREDALTPSRRLLFEDHTHSCVDCRKALERAESPRRTFRLPEPSRPQPWLQWGFAAAAMLVIGFASVVAFRMFVTPSGPRATVAMVEGELFRVSDSASARLAPGAELGENEEVRTAKGSRAVLRLHDGSLVEVAERSEVAVSRGWRGSTVQLDRGNVIVEAAKQRSGELRVATRDALVSVKGTIFAVSSGAKGSRVSVVEGSVKVEQGGNALMLKPGDQSASSPALETTGVAADIAWSKEHARYLALLGDLAIIQKKLDALPGPALRYQTKLAQYVPADTALYAAIPNLGATIADATRIFEERVRESAVLREWWNDADSVRLRGMLEKVRQLNQYLGDEIVVAVSRDGSKGFRDPVVLAEVRNPEIRSFLETQLRDVAGDKSPIQFAESAAGLGAARRGQPIALIENGRIAIGAEPATLLEVSRGSSGFASSAFGKNVLKTYEGGANWVFAADMEQILAANVSTSDTALAKSGLTDLRSLVIERRDRGGKTETRASLGFRGDRHGVASWLAAPAPMGSLEFVTPEASFAAAFVVKNARGMLEDLLSMTSSTDQRKALENPMARAVIESAAAFGGEFTFAADGPLLPVPSFKIIAEVYNPAAVDDMVARLVEELNRTPEMAQSQIVKSREDVSGRTFHALKTAKLPVEIHYTFADNYLLMAPSRELLITAISTRAAGGSLVNSSRFRSQLPRDGYTHFSALVYYNLGVAVGPLADQLKQSGLLSPEQQKSMDALQIDRDPALIYVYGEPDRIVVASSGSFFGLSLDSLVGMVSGKQNVLPGLVFGGMRVPGVVPKASQN